MSFVVIFSLVIFGNRQSEAMVPNTEIMKIASGLKNQGVTIEEWSIYEKEEITIRNNEQFFLKVEELKAKLPEFQWEINRDKNDILKVTGLYVQKNHNFQENIQLITTHTNSGNTSYILYEAIGNDWNEQKWGEITKVIDGRNDTVFQESPKSFSCVKGYFSDKMESVLYERTEALLTEFNAKQIEKLSEETFISVSAYTDNWKNVLPAKNGNMNLQIALRKTELGAKTTVVVGTPIITIEY